MAESCLTSDLVTVTPQRDDTFLNLHSESAPGQTSGSARVRIVAVEDERIVSRDLSCRLTRLGYEVVGMASSKAEALKLVETTKPDLVLMDIRLTGAFEGIDAAQEIRLRFDVPVVYVTGHSDSGTLRLAKLTEPFGYILKPFEDRDLKVAVETAIYKHRAERGLRNSEQRLRLAQKAARVGVFDWDLETGEMLLTPELEDIYRLSIGSVSSAYQEWVDRIHPDDRPGVLQLLAEWKDSGNGERKWEHRIVRPPDQVRVIETRAEIYRDGTGRAVRIVGAQLDITDRAPRPRQPDAQQRRKYPLKLDRKTVA